MGFLVLLGIWGWLTFVNPPEDCGLLSTRPSPNYYFTKLAVPDSISSVGPPALDDAGRVVLHARSRDGANLILTTEANGASSAFPAGTLVGCERKIALNSRGQAAFCSDNAVYLITGSKVEKLHAFGADESPEAVALNDSGAIAVVTTHFKDSARAGQSLYRIRAGTVEQLASATSGLLAFELSDSSCAPRIVNNGSILSCEVSGAHDVLLTKLGDGARSVMVDKTWQLRAMSANGEGVLAFSGQHGGREGVYVSTGGSAQLVFEGLAIRPVVNLRRDVVFIGSGARRRPSLFILEPGKDAPNEVVHEGACLDGRTVSRIGFDHAVNALGQIVFAADFERGPRAYFLADPVRPR